MSSGDITNNYVAEADDTRERIASTIDELQNRLSPRRIVGDAVGSIQSGGSDLVEHSVKLFRSHPVAIVAGALVIGAAMLGTNKLKHATVNLGDDRETYSDFDDDYRSVGERGERFALSRGGAGGSIENNPVIAVLVGVAAGALIGILFPETERERRLLGLSGERLLGAAKAAADTAREELGTARAKVADVTGHAKSAVQSVVGAAKREYGERA